MKQLQNNFTTPEQSKRLLELGVPADSAECERFQDETPYILSWRPYSEFIKSLIYTEPYEYTPCWSVGRLIQILKICVTDKTELHEIFEELEDCVDETKILIQIFKEYRDVIDFSKLEE